MSSITSFEKYKINNDKKYSLKRCLAFAIIITRLGLAPAAIASENEISNSNNNEIPVYSTIKWGPNIEGIDDSTAIFNPDYSTKPTPLEIDENMTDEEKLEVYFEDMQTNGFLSEGTCQMINWYIGPITDLKIGPDQTISDVAKDICVKKYSGEEGKRKWKLSNKYISFLHNILVEECKKYPNIDLIADKWVIEVSDSNEENAVRELSFDKPEETLWIIKFLIGYLNNNDPTKVVEQQLEKLKTNNHGNSKLDRDLFSLRVEQYTKKKSIRL